MPRPLREYRIPRGGEFGAGRAGGRVHHGCDYHPLDNNDGEPIYGTGPGGVVTHIGYNGDVNLGLGHNVTITYPQGRVTIDGHMMERTPLHVGSPVDENTVVGHVGHTGNAVNASPPGSHDHHQVTINGVLVDPEAYYGAQSASLDATLINPNETDDDMKIILHTTHKPDGSGTVTGIMNYLVGEQTFKPLIDHIDLDDAIKIYGAPIALDDARINLFVNVVSENRAARNPSGPTAAEIAAAIVELMPTKYTITAA